MKNNFIEKIVEEKVKTTDNNFENTYHLTFNAADDNISENTITLSGKGSLKVLLPV